MYENESLEFGAQGVIAVVWTKTDDFRKEKKNLLINLFQCTLIVNKYSKLHKINV